MGTILTRQRKHGGTAYMAKIILKRDKKVIHRESRTFESHKRAKDWIRDRETELAKPGALDAKQDYTLSDAIDRYMRESKKRLGRTKEQVLNTLQALPVSGKACDAITSEDIVSLARDLSKGRDASTVGNYMSHLASIFAVAKPAWGYPLSRQAMDDARIVTHRLGLTSKSKERDRRPTLDELDTILAHFEHVHDRRPSSIPMVKIVAFAIFSTRRQEEIVRMNWADFEPEHSRVLIRDMKHPGDKEGNDTWCDLPPEAVQIIQSMPNIAGQIFPYTTDAISAAFTRACQFLEIDDLRFHDLRHDGVSRLFEIGWQGGSIPHVAAVSGHRSWKSLQRYTHVRQKGDKYAGWPWLEAATAPADNPRITQKGGLPRSLRSARYARQQQPGKL